MENNNRSPLMQCLLDELVWIDNYKEGDPFCEDEDEKHENRVMASQILAGFDKRVKHVQTRLFSKPQYTTMQKRRYTSADDHLVEKCIRDTNRAANNMWTVYDDKLLSSAVRRAFNVSTSKYTCPWTYIARVLFNGEKTGKQCKARWENHVDYRVAKGKWRPADTITLVRSLCESETNQSKNPFMDASVRLGGTRTRVACRNKWLKLKTVISKRKHIQLDDATAAYVLKIIET